MEGNDETLHLYVKANAFDGVSLGDCPFSQRVMMVLKIKHVPGKFTPINLNIKPKWFEDLCTKSGIPSKTPVLHYGDIVMGDSNEICDYLDNNYRLPRIKSENRAALTVPEKIFNRFSAFVRNKIPAQDEKLKHAMEEELGKLERFLGSEESPGLFLDGDILKHPDCLLLPKLHHLRVACAHYKKYVIPDSFENVLAYLKAADSEPAFESTKCTDKAIVEGWRKHM